MNVTTAVQVSYLDGQSRMFNNVHPDSIKTEGGMFTFEIDDSQADILYVPLVNVLAIRTFSVVG